MRYLNDISAIFPTKQKNSKNFRIGLKKKQKSIPKNRAQIFKKKKKFPFCSTSKQMKERTTHMYTGFEFCDFFPGQFN
jgi:hypothetical protein